MTVLHQHDDAPVPAQVLSAAPVEEERGQTLAYVTPPTQAVRRPLVVSLPADNNIAQALQFEDEIEVLVNGMVADVGRDDDDGDQLPRVEVPQDLFLAELLEEVLLQPLFQKRIHKKITLTKILSIKNDLKKYKNKLQMKLN